jgi:hypothetical protein
MGAIAEETLSAASLQAEKSDLITLWVTIREFPPVPGW